MPTWKPDCDFYFEDYYRGREQRDCRLLARSRSKEKWDIGLCRSCPVPRIRQANRCPEMILEARIRSGLLGFGRKVVISAFCMRTMRDVVEPMVGCGECHSAPGSAYT